MKGQQEGAEKIRTYVSTVIAIKNLDKFPCSVKAKPLTTKLYLQQC